VTAVAAALIATGASHRWRARDERARARGGRVRSHRRRRHGVSRRLSALQARVQAAPDDYTAWASLGLAYVERRPVSADPRLPPQGPGASERSLAINTSDRNAMTIALTVTATPTVGVLPSGSRVATSSVVTPERSSGSGGCAGCAPSADTATATTRTAPIRTRTRQGWWS